mmetsp:Transcript_19840/g.59945  ORF Transcript_19840/g.59945 Transcript_19840/m.59945 type:complete len:108 (+) Transcript_19840:374-697(+)
MGENAAATTGPGAVSGEAKFDINDVFSLRRPKDAKAGLASGAKSVGKGFLAGAATLVAAPAVGALQEGALGFGKGLATGAPRTPRVSSCMCPVPESSQCILPIVILT